MIFYKCSFNTWRPFYASVCLFLFIFSPAHAQVNKAKNPSPRNFTLAAELKNFYDISMLPAYRDGSVESQVSSWDTTGGNDDGFSGKYSYISRNTDSSLVLIDIHGAGVINRIWTPTPTQDTLDFFIDDDRHPVLSIRYEDLFSGLVFPFVAPLCGNQLGGYYCYFPILFQKSCRIVARAKKMQFHQIGYRLYPKNSRVESFTTEIAGSEKEILSRIDRLWNKENRSMTDFIPGDQKNLETATADFEIKPGEKATLFDFREAGRILGIEFYMDGNCTEFNKNIDLQVHWDNDRHPAVDCPLADFFGYSFGVPSMEGLLLGSRGDTRYCYFPMPFDRQALGQLVYRHSDSLLPALTIKAKIYYTRTGRDSLREGRFYTSWKSNTLFPQNGPHVFLNTSGKGHYVGTILQARGLYAGMTYFFEGDDSTATDGTFRMHGTGSEDYFNGGWYALPDRWDASMSLPLHGCLDYSLPFSRTGGYRFFLSDKIPFEKNIFHSIEHGPVQNEIPVAYTSLAIYYGNTAPSQVTEPTSVSTEVPIPDTLMIYPQLANFNIRGDVQVKSQWAYPTGGTSFLFTVNDESVLRIPIENIPAGNYKIFVDFAKTPDGSSFSLWQRQTQISAWIPTASAGRERVEQLSLGEIQRTQSWQTISFRFKTEPAHTGFFLNRLVLVKIKK